jgi:hypothetical protein
MQKAVVFKTLIDILFIGLCFGFLSLIFVAPFGLNMFAMENIEIYDWSMFSWTIHILSVVSYVLLLIGIKQLRQAAKHMLKKNIFETKISDFLRKSGKYLILSSVINYLVFLITFIRNLTVENKLNIIFDNNLLLQMMVTAVGLFFLMQSDVIKTANRLKNENDLTI